MPKNPNKMIPKVSFEEFRAKIMKADLNTIFIFGAILLVLVVGLYAIFASGGGDGISGNPACGKIVIAADGPSFRANVSPTLVEAKYFLVVDPLSKKLLERVKNPYRGAGTPGRDLLYLISSKGEEAVIVGDVDAQSYSILAQFGIRVFGGYAGRVKDVIGLYRQAKVSPMPQPAINSPAPVQDMASAPVAYVPDTNNANSVFMCPQCRWTMSCPGVGGGAGPLCPRCRMGMTNQSCPIGTMRGGMGYNQMQMQGSQVAFGFGDQAFICPTCNWKMRCPRQGNAYPNCPNCGSAMAQDMSNNGFLGIKPNEIFAANTVPIQNVPEQVATPQPNFWQGRDSRGYFVCPSCNWRMYAERPLGEYPRCPNCRQIMARGGVISQNSGNQFVVPQGDQAPVYSQSFGDQFVGRDIPSRIQGFQAPVYRQNFGDQFGGRDILPRTQVLQSPPPIYSNSPLVHDYRGVCTNCHQILNNQQQAPAYQGNAQGQAGPQDAQGNGSVQAAINNNGTCVLR